MSAVAIAPVRESGAGTQPATMVEYFWRTVAAYPAEPALHAYAGEHRWTTTTWREFGDQVRELAGFLLAEGAAEADHAAIWSANRPEWHIADMAILNARLRPTPLYFSLSGDEAAYVLSHSQSVVAFVDDTARLGTLLELRERLPALRRVVVMGDGATIPDDPFVMSWQTARAHGRAFLARSGDELDRRIAAVTPDDIATLIYTSGTTGPPKAVMLTHRNLDAAVRILTQVIPVTHDDRVISYLPLAHIAERLASEMRQYVFGNAIHFAASLTHIPVHLKEIRPTFFVGVPRVWEKFAERIEETLAAQSLLKRTVARWAVSEGMRVVRRTQRGLKPGLFLRGRHALAERLVLRTVRTEMGLDQATVLITAAAPMSAEVLRFLAALGLEVCELYGMTEDCGVTSVNHMGHAHFGTVGPPLPGVDVRLAEDGEVLVRCDTVFAGYYKDEAATAATMEDGWLRTGDVGAFDADGYLRITGRKKDIIITAGGKNISPSNIELALEQEPLISKAVVIGDRRPFVSALIAVEPQHTLAFGRIHGIDASVEEICRTPQFLAHIQAQVDEVNATLAGVEQVKRWQVIPHEFSVGEELTPTFKVRRAVVAQRYADLIDLIYPAT